MVRRGLEARFRGRRRGVARLLEVRGDTLLLGGADVVDGTPVLDIKPYVTYFLPPTSYFLQVQV